MRINALPNALGNALFPFGAEAQGGVLPPLRAPGGGYYPLYPPLNMVELAKWVLSSAALVMVEEATVNLDLVNLDLQV